MKATILVLTLMALSMSVVCQQTQRIDPSRNNTGTPATGVQQNNRVNPVNPPRQNSRATSSSSRTTTISTRGQTSTTATVNSSTKTKTAESPFVSDIHPASGAKKVYDSLSTDSLLEIRQNRGTVTVASSPDTIGNVNTVIDRNITTNSGAVDKSGRAQFGQSNWGDSRSTIGESQWTVPPPVVSSFRRDLPNVTNAEWGRNKVDTTIYTARYRSGSWWVLKSYNSTGETLNERTEIPLQDMPKVVTNYLTNRQPVTVRAVSINMVKATNKPEVYEVTLQDGKIIYLDKEGREVNY